MKAHMVCDDSSDEKLTWLVRIVQMKVQMKAQKMRILMAQMDGQMVRIAQMRIIWRCSRKGGY